MGTPPQPPRIAIPLADQREYYDYIKYILSPPRNSWIHEHVQHLTSIPPATIKAIYEKAKKEDLERNAKKHVYYHPYESFFQYLDLENNGQVTYYFDQKHDPRKAKGVYSTCVYMRNQTHFKSYYEKFLKGIYTYTEMMRRGQPFSGWSLIIYTDYYTARILEGFYEYYYHKRMPHTVVMAIVEWLEKKEANPENFEHIDSAFLRCARFRAFVDFPNGPVAIRDADTIFFKYYKDFTAAHVLEAEVTFWNAFLKRPERFSISSQKEYKNQFHTDALCGNYRITPGTFAGFVNSKGGIQEWTDSGLFWKECMDYIRARDHIHVSKEPQVYIGKDEQILLFRIIPKLFERIFFFHLEYTDKAELTAPPPKGLGIQLLSAKYNEIVFSEPTFAANLKSTFAKQIANYLRVCGIV